MIATTNPVYFINLKGTDPSQEKENVGDVCIANISSLERTKRLKFGIQTFIFTLVILGVMIALDLNPLWRLLLLFLFWASATGYFQARDKTWVSLASRGSRKFGDNEEKIEDQAELIQVRRQARRVILKAFVAALCLTLLVYLIPL